MTTKPGTRSAIRRGRSWGIACACVMLAVSGSQTASGHGDLYLRIQALTREIASATTNKANLYLARGELQREHGGWKAAADDYDQAAALQPELVSIDFCRARLLADEGKLDAAKMMFDKGLAADPSDGEALVGRARVLLKLGETNSAVADFRRGIELLPTPDPEYCLVLAQTLAQSGRKDEAVASLDLGMLKTGFIIKLQACALDLEIAQSKQAQALARLERIIQQAARKESWLARKGDILLSAGQLDPARQAFMASLAAIKSLPPRLQQSPGMIALAGQVNASLERLAGIQAARK